MEVPNVKRKDYQLIGMEDDFLSLMDDSGDTRDDLKCPEEGTDVGNEVRASVANETDILVRPVYFLFDRLYYIQNDPFHILIIKLTGSDGIVSIKT